MAASADLGRGRRLALGLVLVLGTLGLYARVGTHEFVVYDDPTYVYENDAVRSGLSSDGIAWAMTASHASNWHPITWLSHMLDVELFGLDPGGHHWTSVGFHALNALLLFALLARTTGRVWPSFLAAALFAWHPLRVESVAWISERKDVLSGFFGLLTLWAYVRWTIRPSAARYACILVAFVIGLMAKPMLVTLPLLLFFVDRWPLGQVRFEWRSKVPLFAIAGVSAAITIFVQRAGGAVTGLAGLDPGVRVLNSLASLGTYLWQTLWPTELACFYPHAGAVSDAPLSALVAPAAKAAVVLALLSAVAFRLRARRPYVAFGLLWYGVMLLPVSGLVQVGMAAHADRYTYLPLIGLACALAFGLADIVRVKPRVGPLIVAAAGGALVALAVLTLGQVRVWRTSETLFEHALLVTDQNHIAHANLGWVHLLANRNDAAREELTQALRIHPGDQRALANLGIVLLRLGRFDESREALERCRDLNPDDWRVHGALGELAFARGDDARAAAAFETSLGLGSSSASTWIQLGKARLNLDRLNAAEEALERAIALNPTDAEPHFVLGILAEQSGATDLARSRFERALLLDPAHSAAENALARLGG